MKFTEDKENKEIHVARDFAAHLPTIWSAWTDAETLDKWWAPKPWKAVTKEQEFKPGGIWLYKMVGPDGETHWSRCDYTAIEPQVSYAGKDAFCDENGNINDAFPRTVWIVNFTGNGPHTTVNIRMKFDKVTDMEQLLEMGFKEGFTAGMDNLDELLGGK